MDAGDNRWQGRLLEEVNLLQAFIGGNHIIQGKGERRWWDISGKTMWETKCIDRGKKGGYSLTCMVFNLSMTPFK
jgi:hypothetical protein